MSVESYCFAAIAVVSGIISAIAFSFYRMGFVGPGPLCLALILLAAGVIGAVVCAKDKRKPKKAKKAKKAKKGKKEEDAQVD